MAEYIEREALQRCRFIQDKWGEWILAEDIINLPAADVRPVVLCRDCKHNNACLTQAFVEEASRVPFDRSTFFCADGVKREES